MSGWMVIGAGSAHTEGDGFPQDASNKVKELVSAGYGLRNVVFTPDGHWLVLLDGNAYWHDGVPQALTNALGSLAASGFQVTDVELRASGGFAIVGANNGYFCSGVVQAAYDAIGAGEHAGHTLKSVVFTPGDEWLILFEGNVLTVSPGFPADCLAQVRSMIAGGFTVDDVSFSPEGSWAVVAEGGYFFGGGTGGALAAANAMQAQHPVRRVAFGLVEAVTPQFPIQAERRTDLQGCGGHMDTTVTIDAQGHLTAVTHTWEDTTLRGFHGGVVVVLLDGNGHSLWASPTQVYGVDGRWVGNSDRTDGWSATVPAGVLGQARQIAIQQTWDPTNTAAVIAQWLAAIKTDASLVASIVQSITTIVAAV